MGNATHTFFLVSLLLVDRLLVVAAAAAALVGAILGGVEYVRHIEMNYYRSWQPVTTV